MHESMVILNGSSERPEFAIRDEFLGWMLAHPKEWAFAREKRILVDAAKAKEVVQQLGGLDKTYIDGDTVYTGHALPRCKIITNLMGNYLWFCVCAANEDTAKSYVDKLLALEVKITRNEPRVPIAFRTLQNNYQRMIDVPKWQDIMGNYPQATRDQMATLLAPDYRPTKAGQLILWHGEPGTGKTYLLRAMASEWRKWCRVNYIVDPENFFAGTADYTLSVLLGDAPPILMGNDKDEDEDEEGSTVESPWKLIVAEDTGELLTHDAKQRVGQGLSRLLNIVDGMVGQGLKVLVLITSNEPIAKMHPAVVRNGRCLNLTEFGLFPVGEAKAWVEQHEGNPDLVKEPMRLADMYALLDGRKVAKATPRSLGFGKEAA